MPELPEVEATRENLERWLAGRAIRAVRVLDRRILGGQGIEEVDRTARGARVRGVARRGKFLRIDLGRRGRLVLHLGMTGSVVARRKGEEDPPGTRVVIELAGGRRVVFADRRLLGRFQVLRGKVEERVARLGVEPLSREFTPEALAGLLARSRRPVKLLLMDQDRVAGLGNIMASESLFEARIHPARPADRLARDEVRRLHRAIRKTLRRTLRRARAPEVKLLEDGAENRFLVYDREGEPCPRCGGRIRRIVQGARSTYFCPRCQRAGGKSRPKRARRSWGSPGRR